MCYLSFKECTEWNCSAKYVQHRFQVSLSELEGQIRQHACVRDVAVIGKSNPWCGEVPVAFIVLSDVGIKRVEQGIDVKESIAVHV